MFDETRDVGEVARSIFGPDRGRGRGGGMIATGERLPGIRVWLEPSTDGMSLDELTADGPLLLLFYYFDWSST